MTLPEIFFNPKQAREMANHSSKKKKKTRKKRKGKKKIQNLKSLKPQVTFWWQERLADVLPMCFPPD